MLFPFVQLSEFFSKLVGKSHNKAVTAALKRCATQNQVRNRGFPQPARNYFAVTSECVMAWTERAMRFCTPTLRISFAT